MSKKERTIREREDIKLLKEREYIVLHRALLEVGLGLSPETRGRYYDALVYYSLNGELPEDWTFEPPLAGLWPLARTELDRGITKYLNGKRGGPPKGNKNRSKSKDVEEPFL